MNHRDRNAHEQLRATAHRRRLAEHDAACTGRERRSTARERRRMAAVTRWTLIVGAVVLAVVYLAR